MLGIPNSIYINFYLLCNRLLRKVGNDLFVICFMHIFLHKPHHWSPPLTLWLLSNCLSMKPSPCLTANFWLLRFFLPLVKNDCGKNWHTPFIDCWNWLRAVSLVSDSESCANKKLAWQNLPSEFWDSVINQEFSQLRYQNVNLRNASRSFICMNGTAAF